MLDIDNPLLKVHLGTVQFLWWFAKRSWRL